MRKVFFILICLCGVLTLFITGVNVGAYDDYYEESEEKTYYNGNIDDDFFENKIIIVLSKKETFKMKDYSITDFPEINCKKVTDLTSNAVDLYKNKTDYGESMIDFNKFHRILCLELYQNSKEDVLLGIKRLEKRKEILSAEPSFPYQIMTIPNDTQVANQWGLTNACAFDSWNIAYNASQVLVGIIDTGIDSTHNDLTNNIYRATPHNLTTTLHRDFTNGTESGVAILEPSDQNGHGTHVAGIIGAEGNNNLGVAGICWNVKMVSLRVAGNDGTTNTERITNAISYAASKNIPILNCSIGGSDYSSTLKSAIDSYSGLVVCAAGNSGVNIDNNPVYPASYDSNNIISVGAIDSNNNRSDWNNFFNLWGLLGNSSSNYGDVSVDIYAPGTDVLSTLPNNMYDDMSGTSMSAPFVTGAAALLLAANNTLTNLQLKSAILNGASQIYITVPAPGCGGTITKSVLKLNILDSIKLIAFKTNSSGDTITGTWFTANGGITIPSIINNTIITGLGQSSFEGYISLTNVAIPSSVTYIGNYAFYGCSNLGLVEIERAQAELTTLGSSAFYGCSSSLQIKVPKNRIADYKNKTGWSNYSSKIIPSSTSFPTIGLTNSIDYSTSCTLSAGYNKLYKLSVSATTDYVISTTASYGRTIKLYNSSMTLLASSSSTINRRLYSGNIYYLSVEFSSTSTSGTISLSIIDANHTHSYGAPYVWVNYTQHSKTCSCGAISLEGHAVQSGSFGPGQQYATCLICGGLASIGIIGPMSQGSYPTTLNGSYILPNGVAVLVEDDIEAYLNGTLIFNYPNVNSPSSNIPPYILKREEDVIYK